MRRPLALVGTGAAIGIAMCLAAMWPLVVILPAWLVVAFALVGSAVAADIRDERRARTA